MLRLTSQMTRYPAGSRMPWHADGCRRLSVLVSGDQEETARRRSEPSGTGSVALKDPEFVHRNRFGTAGTTIVSVQLPDDAVEALGYPAQALEHWRWHHGGPASLIGLRLAAGLRRCDSATVEECLLELLQAFTAGRRPVPDLEPGRLGRIRDRLHDDPERTPSLRELAQEEGLHPVSLGRAFRRAFGCSITRYRQRIRAAAVARALLESDDSLVNVTLDHGFADLSHMTRVFRRELGSPPGAFRTQLGAAARGLEPFKTEWAVAI